MRILTGRDTLDLLLPYRQDLIKHSRDLTTSTWKSVRWGRHKHQGKFEKLLNLEFQPFSFIWQVPNRLDIKYSAPSFKQDYMKFLLALTTLLWESVI